MYMVEYRQTMKNARPKFVESNVVVRTVAQMRAEKRIEAERLRREQSRAWVARMEERHKAEMARQAAESEAPEYAPPEGFPIPEKGMRVAEIISNIAAVHGIPVEAIMSPRRDRQAVNARFDAIVAVRNEHPHLSLTQMGRIFRKDHASIHYALSKRGAKTAGTSV